MPVNFENGAVLEELTEFDIDEDRIRLSGIDFDISIGLGIFNSIFDRILQLVDYLAKNSIIRAVEGRLRSLINDNLAGTDLFDLIGG